MRFFQFTFTLLLFLLPANAAKKEEFFEKLSNELKPAAASFATACSLEPFHKVEVSSGAMSYNATVDFIKKSENDTAGLLQIVKGIIGELGETCRKTPNLGARIKKAGLVNLYLSFRSPADDPKANLTSVSLNGSEILIKTTHGRPAAEVAPPGLMGTQLNNRVR